MPHAQFEEREYEGPLYRQLERLDARLWSPGQVLENRVGIDRASFVPESLLFSIHGFDMAPTGVYLNRVSTWARRMLGVPEKRALPNFALNLFLQAKRPFYGKTPPKDVRACGVTGSFWRITLEQEQQETLEAIDSRLAGRALVTYAAPTFHKEKELWKHTVKQTLVENSTFPGVRHLRGHGAWYYNAPGVDGVARSEPERIEGLNLSERISAMLENSQLREAARSPWEATLVRLAAKVSDAVLELDSEATFRRARFASAAQAIDSATDGLDAPWLNAYSRIMSFCIIYEMSWMCVSAP